MRKEIILIPIIALLFIAGCATEKPIGGETDEHGCMLMAGYTWCESKQKCLRTWEEDCPTAPPVQEGLTIEECADADGRVVNTTIEMCEENEISIGGIGGFAYLHLCCVAFPESKKLTIEEAMEIAQNSECTEKGDLTDNYMYNENSKTWWIDLDMKEEFKKDYCNPACVVYEFTKTAEINWRCMGALPPE